jgi:hypothetical protein
MRIFFPKKGQFLRVLAAVVLAHASAFLTTLVFALITMPFEDLESNGTFYYSTGAVEGFLRGFAFVFLGSLIWSTRWRATVAGCLLVAGVGSYVLNHVLYSSSPGFPVWHFSSCIAGGVVAASLRVLSWRRQKVIKEYDDG